MPSLRRIRGRIKSTQNIAQITRAMQMVAASKMKKAQEAALLGKAYADKISQATRELSGGVVSIEHPLLGGGNPKGKQLVIVISTNKGLCGGLNASLFRNVIQWFGKSADATFVSVGQKGSNFVAATGRTLVADFSESPTFLASVPALTQMAVSGFIDGSYKEVFVVYNAFINALKQIPTKKRILPLKLSDQEDLPTENHHLAQFEVEPSIDDVLEHLLPHYLENQIRSAIYEAEASEHSARMIAMKNATDAAYDVIDGLTLQFNKARQEKITYEIADIVTARMAVELRK